MATAGCRLAELSIKTESRWENVAWFSPKEVTTPDQDIALSYTYYNFLDLVFFCIKWQRYNIRCKCW